MNTRKGVIYARFSPRRNEDKCESIETQFELCRQYCQNNNIEIIGEFSDRALSGAEENRPGLWAAVDQLKRNYVLVTYRLDRLARSVYLSHLIERAVQKKKAAIISTAGEGTWKDTPEDELIRGFLRLLAEWERKTIAARTKAAMIRHQKNGRRMSCLPPYGWKIDPQNPKHLLKDKGEQVIINQIIRWHKSGCVLREIISKLDQHNLEPRKKTCMFKGKPRLVKAKWTPIKVNRIIQRYYLGLE